MPLLHFASVGPMDNNVYLIYDDGSKQAMLVDPTIQSQGVWDHVERLGLTLEYIVNTHGHSDHCWNNAHFKARAPGARLLIHEADEPMYGILVQSGLRWGVRVEPSPPADGHLEDGMVLPVGEVEVAVRHTPGHTPGSCCLYVPGALITGDTLFMNSIGRHDSPGGSLEQLLESIRTKLMVLPDSTIVYPGHGPTSDIGYERESNPFLDPEALKRMGLA